MTFGQTIAALRIYRNRYQYEVANAAGVNVQMISLYEADLRMPRNEVRQRILDYLHNIPMKRNYTDPHDEPRPHQLVMVSFDELSARSPMGFRYATGIAPEFPEVWNENVADGCETVGKGMFNNFNLWP